MLMDMNNKAVVCIIALVVTAGLTAASASAGQIVVGYTFSRPEISQITIGIDSCHRITMPNPSELIAILQYA